MLLDVEFTNCVVASIFIGLIGFFIYFLKAVAVWCDVAIVAEGYFDHFSVPFIV